MRHHEQISLRHLNNDEDAAEKLNRTEVYARSRAEIPTSIACTPPRADAESINRALEDTLYWNRAHSVGHLRQEADLLGFALMVNSLTIARASRSRGREGRRVADSAPTYRLTKHVRMAPSRRWRPIPHRSRGR